MAIACLPPEERFGKTGVSCGDKRPLSRYRLSVCRIYTLLSLFVSDRASPVLKRTPEDAQCRMLARPAPQSGTQLLCLFYRENDGAVKKNKSVGFFRRFMGGPFRLFAAPLPRGYRAATCERKGKGRRPVRQPAPFKGLKKYAPGNALGGPRRRPGIRHIL